MNPLAWWRQRRLPIPATHLWDGDTWHPIKGLGPLDAGLFTASGERLPVDVVAGQWSRQLMDADTGVFQAYMPIVKGDNPFTVEAPADGGVAMVAPSRHIEYVGGAWRPGILDSLYDWGWPAR